MDHDFISKTMLFQNCSRADVEKILRCLNAVTRSYKKGEIIYLAGTAVSDIGMVLSGSVQIESTDLWGNRSILDVPEQGDIFAETYACIPDVPLMVNVAAGTDCEILFLKAHKLLRLCDNMCPAHNTVMQNLVMISAGKNLRLSRRMFHTSPKTIRGRLMSYFSEQIVIQGKNRFEIPFDRQQLADYLNLDRSALSKELGKMKKDGLLDYHKNMFHMKTSGKEGLTRSVLDKI